QLQAVLGRQQHASRLVDQLLAIALSSETGAVLQLQRVDLAACARDRLLQLLPLADKAGVELEAGGLDEPAWVMAAPALLDGLL
ncbi:hypothetical protein ABTL31_19450, partial [Acinetobacter baumannii]